jgi:hypothetical protein
VEILVAPTGRFSQTRAKVKPAGVDMADLVDPTLALV